MRALPAHQIRLCLFEDLRRAACRTLRVRVNELNEAHQPSNELHDLVVAPHVTVGEQIEDIVALSVAAQVDIESNVRKRYITS